MLASAVGVMSCTSPVPTGGPSGVLPPPPKPPATSEPSPVATVSPSATPTPTPTAVPTATPRPTATPSGTPTPSGSGQPPSATASCDPGSAVASGERDPACFPFSVSSPWNTPMGTGAQFDGGGACTTDLRDPSQYVDTPAAQWSHPVYLATPGDPTVAIYMGGSYQRSIQAPAGMRPADPQFSAGGDAHLHIVDPSHTVVDEMWQARPFSGDHGPGWNASGYTRVDLYSAGVGQGGERAYGGSAIAGLVREWELRAGVIQHAITMAIPQAHQSPDFVWPASARDGAPASNYHGHIGMGQLVAIPASVGTDAAGHWSVDGFKRALGIQTQAGLEIALAARNYGVYLVDSSDGYNIAQTEPKGASLVAPASQQGPDGASDSRRIFHSLQCVTNNGAGNVGGGGARLAPAAPPLRPH
jgi:hypothetical protein